VDEAATGRGQAVRAQVRRVDVHPVDDERKLRADALALPGAQALSQRGQPYARVDFGAG
jgi:hypothetical protein